MFPFSFTVPCTKIEESISFRPFVLITSWINNSIPLSTSCFSAENELIILHDRESFLHPLLIMFVSLFCQRVHACIPKWNPKIYPQIHPHTHATQTTQSSDLNLKFRARFKRKWCFVHRSWIMSTCCTRFLHFCLLFFINYEILRLNTILNAHCTIHDNRCEACNRVIVCTSDNNTGFSHERVYPTPNIYLAFYLLTIVTGFHTLGLFSFINIV